MINNSFELIELLTSSEDEETDENRIVQENENGPSLDSNINKVTLGNICVVLVLLITNFLKYIDRFTVAG
jgi:hypothetical protein